MDAVGKRIVGGWFLWGGGFQRGYKGIKSEATGRKQVRSEGGSKENLGELAYTHLKPIDTLRKNGRLWEGRKEGEEVKTKKGAEG